MQIEWPLSTGQAAQFIGVTEVTLSNQIRLGKARPPMICGRRAWYPEHVLGIAKILGKDTVAVRNVCAESAATSDHQRK